MIRNVKMLCYITLSVVMIFACRKEETTISSTNQQVIYPDGEVGDVKGFFLLNEGNMGSNKATLDYFDYESGVYSKNIFPERNPSVARELGDVGNDIQIYGDRIYAVINCSNFVEVMDKNDASHIAVVSIPNCRYITFKGDYAYVSSYAGAVELDPTARLGYVAKIDLNTLTVVDECEVGYQPEEMVIAGDKLYVANSGGYRVPDYDTRVSVIDLNSFTELYKIEVGINLHRMELDVYGQIWVSSRGDYSTANPSKTYVVDSETDKVIDELSLLPNSDMARVGDSLYVYSTEWSNVYEKNTVTFAIVNTKTRTVVSRNLIKDGTEANITVPYGIAINPSTKEFFVTDAKDYITPGKVHCYSPEGILKWSATTGDIPSSIVFTDEKLSEL